MAGRPRSRSKLTRLSEVLQKPQLDELNRIWATVTIPTAQRLPDEDDRLFAFNQVHMEWKAIVFWLAYFMMPSIDVRRLPYMEARFKRAKLRAQCVYRLLQLTEGCIQYDRSFRRRYSGMSPLSVWSMAVREMKAWDSWNAYQDMSSSPVTELHECCKEAVAIIKRGEVPNFDEDDGPAEPTNQSIIESAQRLYKTLQGSDRRDFEGLYRQPWITAAMALRDQPVPPHNHVIGPVNGKLTALSRGHRKKFSPTNSPSDKPDIYKAGGTTVIRALGDYEVSVKAG